MITGNFLGMVELQSLQSLLIEVWVREERLSTATGFVATRNGQPFLVTNRHVVTGRDNITGKPLSETTGATPDRLRVWHNANDALDARVAWVCGDHWLYPKEGPIWWEHPIHGKAVDVVAIPIEESPTGGVVYRPYDLDVAATQLSVRVATDVQVVGFPFGYASGGKDQKDGLLALWTRGTIASELEQDFNGLPSFLIDARTRTGQSGSPVLIDGRGEGLKYMMQWGELFGVYSGRINKESDLGVVWRTEALREIIDGGQWAEPPKD